MSDARKVAVIGAGPAGATAAYVLAKNGVEVDLYEASEHMGGMARSMELWGQLVDIGPHRFFSTDPRVNALWLEVIGTDYVMVDRLTRILFRNKFFRYPIKADDALRNLGIREGLRCLGSYLGRRPGARSEEHDTFESWVVSRFGRRLYQHFFKTYTEKLWGIPAADLDSEFAAQRIRGLSLWEVAKGALSGNSRQRHRTLVDQFAYPHEGTGQVYQRMRTSIEDHGGRVHLSTPVRSVTTSGDLVTGLRLADRDVAYDQVVSSMPLTILMDRLSGVPQDVAAAVRSLRFRNTLIVYLLVDAEDVFPDNWIYIHSNELRTGRITNFRNWAPTLTRGRKETILALEYWCFDQDDCWHWDEARQTELAKKEIVMTGLVGAGQVIDAKVVRVPRCYPVYRRGYRADLQKVVDFLQRYSGLQVIGRYGSFKYNNQDHSILMGMLAAENIIAGADVHDLWSINSDYEYQESSLITETGLVLNSR
ncbi:FAD-dependent oxidoreductase [Nonomuraea angiospora]|uniref:FAD-dependent oxidoreductase n=1 Tax=Nonomuraea angiospora TaxID=46172 RepID=UPI0029A74492|nr:FAD-dependent oxidoreductase [Nonomuraea angiospora]MDX3103354.1 FAD-dependent oxidoreductase [Nonomuraea angiospora]